jgi:hypothetical protein
MGREFAQEICTAAGVVAKLGDMCDENTTNVHKSDAEVDYYPY